MYFINLFKLYVDTRIFKGKICTEAAEVATLIFQTCFSNLIIMRLSFIHVSFNLLFVCVKSYDS